LAPAVLEPPKSLSHGGPNAWRECTSSQPRLAALIFSCKIVEVGSALDKAKRPDQGNVR